MGVKAWICREKVVNYTKLDSRQALRLNQFAVFFAKWV